MKIYIPTRGRANDQVTLSHFPEELRKEVTLVVNEYEADQYSKYDCKIMACPESVVYDIATKRKYICENADDNKIVMLDDDLRFYIRKSTNDWHLRYLEPDEFPALFGLLDKWLDDYAHCGVSAREGNNRVEHLSAETTRYMRVLAYNLDMFKGKDIELFRTKVMSDFDMNLQLLSKGLPNKVSFYYAQGHGSSNAPGGCSEWRNVEMQSKGAEILQSLHPEVVKVVERETKTAWGAGKEGTVIRKDVNVQWKKALKLGAQNGELF
jgi:hypothetical protein